MRIRLCTELLIREPVRTSTVEVAIGSFGVISCEFVDRFLLPDWNNRSTNYTNWHEVSFKPMKFAAALSLVLSVLVLTLLGQTPPRHQQQPMGGVSTGTAISSKTKRTV